MGIGNIAGGISLFIVVTRSQTPLEVNMISEQEAYSKSLSTAIA